MRTSDKAHGRVSEPEVTPELAAEHGLGAGEYERLLTALGRVPTYTELGVVSVMWSEHCSYKSSRVHLGKLPTTGERVIPGPGENAGVVAIGDNQAVVFKMESHNHPSFIEPYQGAATGVGGICRDVFTMGARPIALADCLRFGRPENPRTHYLINGVVAGIGGYGNSFGVPTVAGDVNFDDSYDGNILVNAFCLGLARADRIFLGTASGVGNPVIYVGAKTGRDGIHGATMASAEFGEDSEAKRPSVQVGDPFMEKLLLEACLELMASDALVGIQDMGAAGLTSSSVEMAARAGSGIEIDLEKVPQREAHMTPYELMLSESQERMLMVVEKGREDEALEIFAKWDLDAAVIGRVTDSGRVVTRMNGRVYADLPAELLAEGLAYERPVARPAYLDETAALELPPVPENLDAILLDLLAAPNIASKEWVYEQYDHNVRHGTVIRPGAADAGMVRVFAPPDESGHRRAKGVAISAGCSSRQVYLAPHEGTELVVAEAYANLVAVGATPLAVTNCLNFGNPEKPEIMWQFAESIRGLGDALRALEVPVVSGNVSLYNETDGKAIKPTPMLAMVGLLDDVERHVTMGFCEAGHLVAVVGDISGDIGGDIGGSTYLAHIHGREAGRPAPLDIDRHRPVFDAVLAMIRGGHLASAHDVSDGGLAVAVAESAIAGERPLGVRVELPASSGEGGGGSADGLSQRADGLLFGEAPARFVVSLPEQARAEVERIAAEQGASLAILGRTGGDEIAFVRGTETLLSVPVADADAAWRDGFRRVAE
ncbi:phosphoribosylformylglycinamidine synthase subunit PurL [Haliangium sp.]|uniref:phosphoribosylformylglycinamidine synthase subunit PurL n=1 Tax=Haliangium sp. TaxID=2663208 RepID=UPI003D13529D